MYREGLDIRAIQLMLGHATLAQTQRYLNVTDEELRRNMQAVWARKAAKKKQVEDEQAAELTREKTTPEEGEV